MKQVKKWWAAAILGLLLVATLVGVVLARPSARPKAAARQVMTVPAAAFVPIKDGIDWYNNGSYIQLDSGVGVLIAPVRFPGKVMVKSITLYAYDNNDSHDVCAYLFRSRPSTGSELSMGTACSTGASGTDPRVFTTTLISPNRVTPKHVVYLELMFYDSSDLRVYGVKITYR